MEDTQTLANSRKLYSSKDFSISENQITQADFTATAHSATHLTSNYHSLAYQHFSRLLTFKFSLNEKDNELPAGQDHWLVIGEGRRSRPSLHSDRLRIRHRRMG